MSTVRFSGVDQLADLLAIRQEMKALIAHFGQPIPEPFTEEDARWITRYDICRARLAEIQSAVTRSEAPGRGATPE